MIGRDVIVYILQNHLEDEVVFKDGVFVGFQTLEKFAKKHNIGIETARAYVSLGYVNGVFIDGTFYVPINAVVRKG